MRFAVISGVQANAVALEAVLEEIGRQSNLRRILCAGDIVGLGPQPNEVINLLRDAGAESVKGNYDDAVAFDRISSGVDFADPASQQIDDRALAWTRKTLTRENMEYLRELPFDVRVYETGFQVEVKRNEDPAMKDFRRSFLTRAVVGGLGERKSRSQTYRVLMVHGSPRALNEFIRPETANSILATIAGRSTADVLITGHADVTFTRQHEGVLFIGVAGMSGPRTRPGDAGFMLVDTSQGFEAEWIPVSYDASKHLEAISGSGLPPGLANRFDLTSL